MTTSRMAAIRSSAVSTVASRRALEADRRDDADDHEGHPARLLDDARHVDLAEQVGGVAVHQQAESRGVTISAARRRSPKTRPSRKVATAALPTSTTSGRTTSAEFGLAEVLRPQEEDRVGREQQGMDGGESARFRGGLDHRFGRQENLRGGRRLG